MKYCKNCNAEHNDDARFCLSCGIRFDDNVNLQQQEAITEYATNNSLPTEQAVDSPAPETVTDAPTTIPNQPIAIEQNAVAFTPPITPTVSRRMGGFWAWSIINLVLVQIDMTADITLGATIVSLVFGIIALITTIKAPKSITDEDFKIRKKNALILNLAASLITAIGLFSFIIVTVITGLIK